MVNANVLMRAIEERNARVERAINFCDNDLNDWLIKSAQEDSSIRVEFNIILEGDDFYFIDCEMSHAGNVYFSKQCYAPSSWTIFKQYVKTHGFKVSLIPDYCPCCNTYPYKNAFKVTVEAP